MHNERKILEGTHEMQDAKDQWSNTITVKNLKPQLAHLVERPKRRWELHQQLQIDTTPVADVDAEDFIDLSALNDLDTEGFAARILGEDVVAYGMPHSDNLPDAEGYMNRSRADTPDELQLECSPLITENSGGWKDVE